MALNMPEEMYEAVRPHLPKIKERLALPLSNRHPVNTAKGQTLGEEDKERHEWIYIWQKGGLRSPLTPSRGKTRSSKVKTLKKKR
jgi:hypothetical protein